jgi:hypothetical protein
MKLAICVLSAVVLLSGRGESCFQGAAPQLLLRSRNIAGVVTVNGKPWVGAHVWLRESAGAYAPRIVFGRKLGAATTDNNGVFSFANVRPGRYTILTEAELTDVQLTAPGEGQDEQMQIEFYADFCQRASAISADGRVVRSDRPPILGAALAPK